MATLTLTKVWVNRFDNGQAVSAQSSPERQREHEQDGDVATYAGGRQRAITQQGTKTRFVFTLRDVTVATLDTLQLWIGQTVMVRDARGQMFVGTYFRVRILEDKSPTLYDVLIELRAVTVNEGV